MNPDRLRIFARPATIAAAVLLVVVLVVWMAISFILSPGFVTGQLAGVVKAATGRTLSAGGRASVALWPQVQVSLPDVRLSNPPGMYEGQLVEAKRLTVTMTARALFHRRLEISDVRLDAPRFSLVVDEQGKANWALSGQPTGDVAGASQADARAALPPILIEDGDVRFLDQRSGKTFVATGVDLSVKLGEDGSGADVKGAFDWNRDRIGFAAFIKDPARLSGQGSPVDLTAQTARGSLSFSGVARVADGLTLAGQADATVPSLRDLASWLGGPVGQGAGFGIASMSGPLEVAANRVAMTGARFTIDGMNARGDAAVSFGARPKLVVSLGMDRLDLNRWIPPGASTRTSGTAAASGDPGWSDARVDFRALRGIDARFTLAASALVWREMKLGTVAVTGTLADGRLSADLTRATLYDGTATGRIALDGSGNVPGVAIALAGSNLDALPLLRDLAHIGRISGRMDVTTDLQASGVSQREMMSRLSGSARFAFTEGALRGIDVRGLHAALAKAVLQGWSAAPAEKTPFTTLEASFSVADGIAETKDLAFEGGGFRITGAGQSDVLKGSLDFRLKPVELDADGGPKADGLNRLALSVAVTGFWDDPKIYPDIPGILDNPKAAFAQIHALLDPATLKDAGTAVVNDAVDAAVPPDAAAAVKKTGKKLLDKLLKKPDAPAQ